MSKFKLLNVNTLRSVAKVLVHSPLLIISTSDHHDIWKKIHLLHNNTTHNNALQRLGDEVFAPKHFGANSMFRDEGTKFVVNGVESFFTCNCT